MPSPPAVTSDMAVPLHEEELFVDRKHVAGDTVKVRTVTHEQALVVDEAMTHQQVEIVRMAVGRVVNAVPAVREEGEVTIIPVMEEVVVVERRLVLKEEFIYAASP